MKRLFLFLSLFLVSTVQTKVADFIAKFEAKTRTKPLIQPKPHIPDFKKKKPPVAPKPHIKKRPDVAPRRKKPTPPPKPSQLKLRVNQSLIKTKIPPKVAPKPRIKKRPDVAPRRKTAAAVALLKKKERPALKPKSWNEPRNLAIFVERKPLHFPELDAIASFFLESLIKPSNYTILVSAPLMEEILSLYKLRNLLLDPKETASSILEKYKNFPDKSANLIKSMKIQSPFDGTTTEPSLLKPIDSLRDEMRIIDGGMRKFFDKWMLYKTPLDLYILVPSDLKNPGFSLPSEMPPEKLSTFITKNAVRRGSIVERPDISLEVFSRIVYSTIKKLIQGPQVANNALRPLNVFITGHGGSVSQQIAGISEKTFKMFTQLLTTANTASLFYLTCFGGGGHINYLLDSTLPYTMIAIGTNDNSIYLSSIDCKGLRGYFNRINSDPLVATSYLNTLVNAGASYLAEQDFKIRLPHTSWFTPLQLKTKIQTIGKPQALAAAVQGKPIVLSGKPCGLFTTELPEIVVPKVEGNMFIGMHREATRQTLYVFDHLKIPFTIYPPQMALDDLFEKTKSYFTNTFYINRFTLGNTVYSDVVINNYGIMFKDLYGNIKLFVRDPLYEDTRSLALNKKHIHNLITNFAKAKLEKFYWNVANFKGLKQTKEKHRSDSPFSHLKHRLETESFSEELERYANEMLKSLSEVEQMVIKSVVAAKKAL